MDARAILAEVRSSHAPARNLVLRLCDALEAMLPSVEDGQSDGQSEAAPAADVGGDAEVGQGSGEENEGE